MKNGVRWMLGGGVLLTAATVSWGQNARSVTEVWEKNCQNCHGAKGEGGGAGTSSLLGELRAKKDVGPIDGGMELDRRYFDAIKNGVPDRGMAPFGETMKDEQVWALVVHIRELQRDAWRQQRGLVPARKAGSVAKSQHVSFTLEPVVDKGLRTPWAVDWLPAAGGRGVGSMLVTEKDGNLRVFLDGKLSEPVKGMPKIVSHGQGGLMDVAVHPEYAKNGWIYLGFAEPSDDGKNEMTKIVRGKLKEAQGVWTWADEQTIFKAKPEHYLGAGIHYGNRIAFQKPAKADAAGRWYVYFTIGERGRMEMAQDLGRPNGKVHRLWDDGKVPEDNPFTSKTYPSIWSYGHRNPQGLAFDLEGNLWDTEHGPRGGDELNLIQKGRNYGWPLVCFGINYNDSPFRTPWPSGKLADGQGDDDLVMPVLRWLPSIAACGFDVCRGGPAGEAFPMWKGDLFAGGLAGQTVHRVRVRNGKVTEQEELIYGHGRVRDVVCGPEGAIYVVLNGPDRVVRLTPAK